MNVHAERFPLMDSVRGLATLAVVAAHAALISGLYSSGSFARQYFLQINTAVDVFFLISGFLLYRPFVRARLRDEPRPDVRGYAWRRFLRIVPAYWVALTVISIWLSLSIVANPSWHVPLFYGFGQIYDSTTSIGGLGQAWTLCVEITFYVLLPIWALLVRRLRMRGELVALGCLWLASVAWQLFAAGQVDASDFGKYDIGPWLQPLPNWLDDFAIGMALAVVSVADLPGAVSRTIERAVARAWPWWVAAALLYWTLTHTLAKPQFHLDATTFVARHELRTLVAFCVLVPAVFAWRNPGLIRRLLASRPLRYVGLVSYGVYLWHSALIEKLAAPTGSFVTGTLGLGVQAHFVLLFGLGALAALAVATVSYYAIERPALSLRGLVGRRTEREQRGEALAEPAPVEPAAVTTIGPS